MLDLSIDLGPDGFMPRQMRAVSENALVRVLNLMIWCEKLPNHLMEARIEARTIFINKKTRYYWPGEFRHITIFSALARLFHCIPEERIDSGGSVRSRGPLRWASIVAETMSFSLVPSFAVYTSVAILYTLLNQKLPKLSECFCLPKMSRTAGIPPPMIHYLEHYYSEGTIYALNKTDLVSPPILPFQDVKQADPLLSVLFNIVIDHLLGSLPRECGLWFRGSTTRAMAFSDSMNLIAEAPWRLQALIDHSMAYRLKCWMRINNNFKSAHSFNRQQGK